MGEMYGIEFDAVKSVEERRALSGVTGPIRKELNITPERWAKLASVYGTVVVHNFGDEYHLSEDERRSQNNLYEYFQAIKVAKRKYSKLSEYVRQYRQVLKTLYAVAKESAMIYDMDEFVKDVLKEKIHVMGLHFPIYKGKDRKEINWSYVMEFILDEDRDPSELDPQTYDDVIVNSEEEADDLLHQYFSDEEIGKMFGDEDNSTIIHRIPRKEQKKLLKNNPEMVRAMANMRKKKRDAQLVQNFVYNMQQEDFEQIERLDRKRGLDIANRMPKFRGDIMDKEDFDRYMFQLENFEDSKVKFLYEDKLRTQDEVTMIELRRDLDDAGWNMKILYGNKEREKQLRRAKKADDAKIRELKARLTRAEKRSKSREHSEFSINTKEKRRKKKKIKGKNKKRANEAMSGIIMNASESGSKHKDWKSYQAEMEDFDIKGWK